MSKPSGHHGTPSRSKETITVFFDPDAQKPIRAQPDKLVVKHNHVAEITWQRGGASSESWRFTYIGFTKPVGTGCDIKVPQVSSDGSQVTTEDYNRNGGDWDLEFNYLIFIQDSRGRVYSSDPSVINRRDVPG